MKLRNMPRTHTSLGASTSPLVLERLLVGFAAGFLSVLIFSNGMIAILDLFGAAPFAPWQMSPTPPFGVPQTFSAAFWGGLWGVTYALLQPWLDARFGWWLGGLVFGALPMLVFLIIVMPLKGLPVGVFLPLGALLVSVVLHTVFGLGTAILFRLGQRLGH